MSEDGNGVAAAATTSPATDECQRSPERYVLHTTTISKPQDWERWIHRFERFRLASNLHLSTDANQVKTLIYCMGDEADDILRGHAQRQQYTSVKNTFETYFVPRKNVIYERAKFNRRVQ